MPVILWIPGFPEAYDYRVALKNTLRTLYKHTKVNQLFGDAEGKPLTSVMNFCSKPNPIKELGRKLNVRELCSSFIQGNIGRPAILSVSSFLCIMILLTD